MITDIARRYVAALSSQKKEQIIVMKEDKPSQLSSA